MEVEKSLYFFVDLIYPGDHSSCVLVLFSLDEFLEQCRTIVLNRCIAARLQ